MKIGVTGTREGLSTDQMVSLFSTLIDLGAMFDSMELHHGDCIGADATAHDIAISLSWKVVVHPPTKDTARAFKVGTSIAPALPYLARNRQIVDDVDVLIVLPKQNELPTSDTRGGTWYTYRYAMKRKTRVIIIIWPNGNVEASHQ